MDVLSCVGSFDEQKESRFNRFIGLDILERVKTTSQRF